MMQHSLNTTKSQCDRLPVCLIAQLVEHCTSVAFRVRIAFRPEFKHALQMNTFDSAINQPFYNYYSTLQQKLIATVQNRVQVQFLKRIWHLVKCLEESVYLPDCLSSLNFLNSQPNWLY